MIPHSLNELTRLTGVIAVLVSAGAPAETARPRTPPANRFVATNGDDAWSGKLARPNADRTDGPFATLERARDDLRARRAAGEMTAGARVVVRQGTYHVSRPFTLGPEDSGTEGAPIVYQAQPGEKPVLSGSRILSAFRPWKGEILQCDVKAHGFEGIPFRQLFFNGKRQILAGYPNVDPNDIHGGKWAYVEAAVEKGSKRAFRAAAEDVKPWADLSQAEVFLFHSYNYYNTIVKVAQINTGTRDVTLAADTYNEIKGDGAERYRFRNLLEELDTPGEWYLDHTTWTLYFWPPAPLDGATVEAPLLDNVIHLQAGTEHVTVQGFVVENSEGTGVLLRDTRNCLVAGCTVRNSGVSREIGGWGPWEDQCGIGIFGGAGNGAIGNDIHHTGGHGIKLTGGDRKTLTPAGNYAENNHIHHTGIDWKQGCGARIEGVGNRFSRNLVHHCPRMAVIFGGNDNVIEYNHMHHTNLETCDTGAIYTGGRDWLTPWGSVVRYNYIHDIGGYGRHGTEWTYPEYCWGIYLDDNCNGLSVIGNIVVGAFRGGIHLHNAHDSLIENNILVDGLKQQMEFNGWKQGTGLHARSTPNWLKFWEEYRVLPAWRKYPGFMETNPGDLVPMSNNCFLRNIFTYSGSTSALYTHRNLPVDRNEFDHNMVWHGGLPVTVGVQNAVRVEVDPASPELITNGGFENGNPDQMPSNWTWMTRPDDRARAFLTEETAHTGKRAMRVEPSIGKEANGNKQFSFVRTDEFRVQAGRGYRLSVWIKADRPGLTVGLVAQSYKAKLHHWAAEDVQPVSLEWQEYTLDFHPPGPASPDYLPSLDNLWIRLDFRHDEGVYWVDDVSLKEGRNPLETKSEWQVWQGQGQDVHSVIADPQFVDSARGDYRLSPSSPALKLGFKPIPFARIGPYENDLRASWPLEDE